MKRVTQEDIILMNEAYLACGTLSGAAKATGWSASTVKKYLIPDFKNEQKVEATNIELPPISKVIGQLQGDNLTCLRPDEEKEIKNLWKEMLV